MNPTLDQSAHIKSNIWLLHLTVLVLTRDVPLSQWSIFWNKFYLYKIYASAKRPLVTNPFSSSSNRYWKSDIIYVRLKIQEKIFMSSHVSGSLSDALNNKDDPSWPSPVIERFSRVFFDQGWVWLAQGIIQWILSILYFNIHHLCVKWNYLSVL